MLTAKEITTLLDLADRDGNREIAKYIAELEDRIHQLENTVFDLQMKVCPEEMP